MESSGGFFGRAAELARLSAEYAATQAGDARIVLIAGEPGVGKTSLAERFANNAGVPVARGRASSDPGSGPYWLFRQVIRDISPEHPPSESERRDIALLAPELADGQPATTSVPPRFEIFETVREYLGRLPRIVLLDDVHWADGPSLALLRHLAERATGLPLFVLATYRDTDVLAGSEFASALAQLAREPAVQRLPLSGLGDAEVEQLLRAHSDVPVDDRIVRDILRRTHGNPFFVAELGRSLGRTELPDVVRDAVRARIGQLTADTQTVVRTAAVIGRDLPPDLLAAVTDLGPAVVLEALDEAADTGVLRTDGSKWGFSHDIVREAAGADVPTARRLEIHLRTGRILIRQGAAPAEIAYRLLDALPLGELDAALAWADRAGLDALLRTAWEDAADLYRRALAASPTLGAAERSRLLLGLGTAHLRNGELMTAGTTLTEAGALAREANDPSAIGAVALAMEGFSDRSWVDTGRQLCDDALALLPAEDSPLRARLLARRASESIWWSEPECGPLSAQALAMAERIGDPDALRSALRARQLVMSGPEGVNERLTLGTRMLAVGFAEHDSDAEMWGRLWRCDALAQLGRISDAASELDLAAIAVDRLRRPTAHWHLARSNAALAAAEGRFDDAVVLARDSYQLAETGNHVMAEITAAVLMCVSSLIGDEELVDTSFEWTPLMGRPRYGQWHLRLGRLEAARRCYRPATIDEFPRVAALPMYATLTEMAAAFFDADTAARLYERMKPHAELFTCGGAGIVVLEGSTHRYLGLAAATAGQLDDAVRHLRLAIDANDRAGMRPYTALTQLDLAKTLARRRRPGDRGEAAALAAMAVASADTLGMAPLRADATRLSAELDDRGASPLTKRENEIAKLIGQGLTNKQIAALVHISERTAENHVQHILQKLGFTTRSQIAAWVSAGP